MRQVRKKTWIVTILAVCLMLWTGTQITVYAAGNHHTEGYFEYSISGDSVTIESYFGSESEVVIPDHIAALSVTKIENAAFAEAGTVTKITIPDTVTEIGNNVFAHMKQLKEVVVQSVGLKVQVPSGCTVTEDYPVYVKPGSGEGEITDPGNTDQSPDDDNRIANTDSDKKNSGTANTNGTPNVGTDGNSDSKIGFEAAEEKEDKIENADAAQDRPGIKTSDNKQITVDDTSNLIEIDTDGNIKVLDKNHNYSVTENEKGETIIKDEEGNQVNSNQKKEEEASQVSSNQKKEESQESEEETPQTSLDQEQEENQESAEKDDAEKTQADTDEEETEAQRSTGKNENAVSEESQEKQENSAPTSDHTGMLLAVLAGVIFVAGVIFWKKKKQH